VILVIALLLKDSSVSFCHASTGKNDPSLLSSPIENKTNNPPSDDSATYSSPSEDERRDAMNLPITSMVTVMGGSPEPNNYSLSTSDDPAAGAAAGSENNKQQSKSIDHGRGVEHANNFLLAKTMIPTPVSSGLDFPDGLVILPATGNVNVEDEYYEDDDGSSHGAGEDESNDAGGYAKQEVLQQVGTDNNSGLNGEQQGGTGGTGLRDISDG
jgi:hypothetical protein